MDAKEIFGKGQMLFLQGNKKESIAEFTKAIEAGEKTETAYLTRGVANLQTEQVDDAIADFGSAIAINDNNMRAHFYRGIANLVKENFKAAIEDLDKTIKLKPDNGAAFFARGTAHARLGHEDEAAKNMKTALMYSETSAHGFADSIGMFKTQFNRALDAMTGDKQQPAGDLSVKDVNDLKRLLKD